MTITTKDGQKVGAIRSTFESAKIGSVRGGLKVFGGLGILYLAGVVTKTALETIPYIADKIISNGSFGRYTLESLSNDPGSMLEQGVALGVTGATGLAIWATTKYGIMPLKRAFQNVGRQATNEASQIYQAEEPKRQVDNHVREAAYQVEGEKQITNIQKKVENRTGAM